MDPRLLEQYERELEHVRHMGAEFAHEFPSVAAKLGLDQFQCDDPYVERLLEGFAFLAARVQVQIASQYPRFTQNLLELVYPHYLCPIASTAIVQFAPDLNDGVLAEGLTLKRHSTLRSLRPGNEHTSCTFRTAHDVTLWPLQVTQAEYFDRDRPTIVLPDTSDIRAGLRIRLRCTGGLTFDQLPLDELTFHLRRFNDNSALLYEQLFTKATTVLVRPIERDAPWHATLPADTVKRVGFDDSEAIFPYDARSFQGYRLLHEYFVLPQRYMFFKLTGLEQSLRQCSSNEVELVVLFNQTESSLVGHLDATDLALFCTPAVNIFPKRADRVHLTDAEYEYHLVPDRARPMDFEVYSCTRLLGYGAGVESVQEFLPFYSLHERRGTDEAAGYYTLRRTPRLLSSRQKRVGARAGYIGNEVFVMLVDAGEAPYRADLRQLAPELLCTNRDLPLLMPKGLGDTDFTIDASAPVQSTRCIAGPTRPMPSLAYSEGEMAWRLVNHLSLNYLTLCDNDEWKGAAALRELLRLYSDRKDAVSRQQIESLKSVKTHRITRPMPGSSRIAFGRALEIAVTMDESGFKGSGVAVLGAVLDEFFAKYVSINSMTETVIISTDRGEIIRWPVRIGRRHCL